MLLITASLIDADSVRLDCGTACFAVTFPVWFLTVVADTCDDEDDNDDDDNTDDDRELDEEATDLTAEVGGGGRLGTPFCLKPGKASLLVDKLLEETSCTAGLVLADLASEAVRGLSDLMLNDSPPQASPKFLLSSSSSSLSGLPREWFIKFFTSFWLTQVEPESTTSNVAVSSSSNGLNRGFLSRSLSSQSNTSALFFSR